MKLLALLCIAVLMVGCSGGSSTPSEPLPDDTPGPGPGPPVPIDGTWDNLPRRPQVEMIIAQDGTWTVTVRNPPIAGSENLTYITCSDTLLALSPVMTFSGMGALDTTATFVAFWEDTSNPRLPQFAMLEAEYIPRFISSDGRDIGPLIQGRFNLNVLGACQAGIERAFWLRM